jgi:hypothetical protein
MGYGLILQILRFQQEKAVVINEACSYPAMAVSEMKIIIS